MRFKGTKEVDSGFQYTCIAALRASTRNLQSSPDGASIASVASIQQEDLGPLFEGDEQSFLEHLGAVAAGKLVCIINDKPWGACYDRIDSIVFSPDSLHVAAIVKNGMDCFVVIGEQPQQPFDQIVANSFLFSPDSARHAYIAVKGRDYIVVIDSQPSPAYREVTDLQFSADGKRVMYVANDQSNSWLVVDGVAGEKFSCGVFNPQFSPSGRRVAYIARADDDIFAVIDDRISMAYLNVESLSFDSQDRVAYIGETIDGLDSSFLSHGERYCAFEVIAEDKVFEPEMGIQPPLAFLSDGGLAYVAGVPYEQYAVIGDHKTETFDFAVGPVVLHHSPPRFAYVAADGGKLWVVVDGNKYPAYAGIGEGTLKFSNDGAHFVYDAQNFDQGRLVVFDGEPGPTWDSVLGGTPIFSPNGQKMAYAAQSGNQMLIVENLTPGKERYAGIFNRLFRYSPDSRILIFAAGETGNAQLHVGSMTSEVFEGFFAPLSFPEANTVTTLAVRGGYVYHVRCVF